MSLNDIRVLITGASGGLGMELARLYAASGRNLIISARRKDRMLELKDELEKKYKIDVLPIEADLADPRGPQQIVQTMNDHDVHPDVLVNNAAVGMYGEFINSDFNDIIRMYQINVLSAMHLIRLVLPGMIARGNGHIVNVASLGAFFPGPLMSAYFATKADMRSFTAAIGYELRHTGVKLTTVYPGPFKSGFQEKTFGLKRDLSQEDRLCSSRQTANSIFRELSLNKKTVVPGFQNKVIYFLSYFVPQSVILSMVFKKQRSLRSEILSPDLGAPVKNF